VNNTYTAQIYIGFRECYTKIVHTLDEAKEICQNYVDEIGLCITVMPIEYIYTNGRESGAVIGLINYPRFPDTNENIQIKAISLAKRLMIAFSQYRVSIVFPDETIMLINEDLDDK